MQVKFVVPGTPKGKGRPRFSKIGDFVKTYTPEETASYENLVVVEYQRQSGCYRFPDEAELDMKIIAYYDIPKSETKKKKRMMSCGELRPTKKPDADNVVKIIADSLNNVAYKDDTQIVDCQVRKFYSSVPRVVVTISEAVPLTEAQKEVLRIKEERRN